MIEHLKGSVSETLRLLASACLDPRDETIFCTLDFVDRARVWNLRGRFLETDYTFHLRHTGDYESIRELTEAIRANRRSAAYRTAWRELVPLLDTWLTIGNANPWIRGSEFSEQTFSLCRSTEQMACAVDRNNWAVGTAFVLAGSDVCMIQQEDGLGEFLMIRGTEAFDSWTTGAPHIHGAQLVAYLEAVARAQIDARGWPRWYELVQEDDRDRDDSGPVAVARTVSDLSRLLQ